MVAKSCRLAVVFGVDGGVGPSAFQQGVEFMRQGLAVAMSSWLVGVLGGGWAPGAACPAASPLELRVLICGVRMRGPARVRCEPTALRVDFAGPLVTSSVH